MSFLKKLFGLGSSSETESGPPASVGGKTVEHKGFTIRATPYKEGGQFQTCGVVSKEMGGTLREHRFVRADRFAGMDEAVEVSLSKGRQIIDEQGERLFD